MRWCACVFVLKEVRLGDCIFLIYKIQWLSVCLYVCLCVCLSVCLSVCVSVPYRSPHRLSDCDQTLTSCCKHGRGGFRNLKIWKLYHKIIHLWAKRKNKKYIYYLGYQILSYQEHTHHSSVCDDTFTSCCKHARGGFGNLKILQKLY